MNFWLLPIVHLLAVMSPGPDFFLILEHSLLHSRRKSLFSALGIACGCLIHMGVVIMAIFFLGTELRWMSQVLKFFGSTYLIFLGINSLRQFVSGFLNGLYKKEDNLKSIRKGISVSLKKKQKNSSPDNKKTKIKIQNPYFNIYFLKGFFCNLLNPKAWAYFLSIFMTISLDFSLQEVLIIVLLFFIITLVWFSLVTVIFTLPAVSQKFNKYRWVMLFLCGITFCIIGVNLILV